MDQSDWLKSIRDKLYDMFRSPMKEEYQHEAFRWVSELCVTCGDLSWMCPTGSWTKDEAKIFSCIASLSMNEVLILLPMIERHLTCGDEPDVEDGKILARSAGSLDYDKLGNHLVILESVIKSLVKGQGSDDNTSSGKQSADTVLLTDCLDSTELLNLLRRMREVINSISEYLEMASKHWQSLASETDKEKLSSIEGSLRILCVWVAEEPATLEPECERFLIDFLIDNLLRDDKTTNDDLIILALHSVCTSSEKLMSKARQNLKLDESLNKYLTHVQREKSRDSSRYGGRRGDKKFKLRCGLVKDLMSSK